MSELTSQSHLNPPSSHPTIMKLSSVFTWWPFITLATTASAQRAYIRSPASGVTVHKGQSVVLQLVRPNSIQGSREVGLALSFQTCANGACSDPVNRLGTVLYTGPYDPQLHEIPGNPYENFTLTIPDSEFFQPGKAQLISTRLHLIGAGPSATLETNTVDVNLVNN
ncbi:hypothetical protein D9756_006103 [Leucocoprinus leucothites]|uniref:Uncharacterized protein n=1 Tax=Leucocoprinus leucothites TaxID=201217 RepID=A0A8H5D3C6_9AGAR|nr:hypothetical protein D9756_006103 [Leucoagaricus leucothites]